MHTIDPTVRDVSSTDWDGLALQKAEPVSFAVAVEIGNKGAAGADLFHMTVCNPSHLGRADTVSSGDWRHQTLVLETLSFDAVRAAVQEKIRSNGPYGSWPDFAAKIVPYMAWEFDGMPYPPFAS